MSNYGPGSAFLLVGGKNISTETYELTETIESIAEQVNGLSETWERHQNVGLGRIGLEASGGLYDDEVAGIIDALQEKGAIEQLVSYGMSGWEVGDDVVMLNGVLATIFNRIMSRDGLTKAHAEYTINGQYRRGVVVNGLTAFSADPFNTEGTPADQALAPRLTVFTIVSNTLANPTVVSTGLIEHGLITGDVVLISGSNSTPTIDGERTVTVISPTTFSVPVNVTSGLTAGTFIKLTSTGAVLDLHVTALALGGFTNVIITPVHSVDGAVFVPLGSAFAAVTVVGTSERKTVVGAVQRYVAIDGDWTGAGSGNSVTPYVAISR